MARKPDPAPTNPAHQSAFAALESLLDGLTLTLGSHAELVLHDFANPEHSVKAISGKVTHRKIGSPISPNVLSIMQEGNSAQPRLNVVNRTAEGRIIKTSTLPVRDEQGNVFGAVCINLDVTELRLAATLLTELGGGEPVSTQSFPLEVSETVHSVLDEEERRLGISLARLSRTEKQRLCALLDRRGVFQLQKAIPIVAKRLGLSRASIYSYLSELRQPETGNHDPIGPGT
ncbi:helix-turn-helix transcriptional regulator [Deinococcus roseus]|uniref:DNA-binding protein n=1 Tax=Deinococcus roseus TaxID=392414 RepID=A0ABQ2D229_9DEIO|nr:PAS domain-containing protein [Deinococcus roseus]GGJ38880.1 DNA-binding protein [Deinococcus roseus]